MSASAKGGYDCQFLSQKVFRDPFWSTFLEVRVNPYQNVEDALLRYGRLTFAGRTCNVLFAFASLLRHLKACINLMTEGRVARGHRLFRDRAARASRFLKVIRLKGMYFLSARLPSFGSAPERRLVFNFIKHKTSKTDQVGHTDTGHSATRKARVSFSKAARPRFVHEV
jgi:hypothetical protein